MNGPGAAAPQSEPEWVRWFDTLAELTTDERAARIAALARERPGLAAELERLFAAEERTAPLLSRPVAERSPEYVAAALAANDGGSVEGVSPGSRIGPYRILAELGRGGMGEVFLAERADGVFESRVALKLVKRGMDSDEIVRRFHRERQILARLEHPGIARLLDGGTAPDGRPYFVLELVEGEPILAWCRRVRATLEERLSLVIAACEAVDAAHRSLVVHRDLKPSNLLVTAGGQVKLLDFGIAKLLAEPPDESATRQAAAPLTPAYAAPEQLLGGPVTTATDVYALGVILYELLTGRSPHPSGRSSAALEAEAPTERPSTVLRGTASSGEAGLPDRRRLARRVQGDLDLIALSALHRDPARRYRSAADLGADLQRFLDGRAVKARPDSALYRARKLVLRHKLAAAALATAALSLVAGTGIAVVEARSAIAQARRAERVKDLLLSIFREADPEQGQGPDRTAREILAAGSQRLEKELVAEPEVQAELLDAVAQIDRSLGLYDPAAQAAQSSLSGRRKLFGKGSAEAALSLATLAEVEAARGNLEEAWKLAERARPAVERRFGFESTEGQRLASLQVFLLAQQGETEKALALEQRMIVYTRRHYGPTSAETGRRLIETAELLGDLSRLAEAEEAAREGIAMLEASSRAGRLEVSMARRTLAELLVLSNHREEAATQYSAVLAQQRAAVGPNHVEVAETLIKQGFLLVELRRDAEAERALREAVRILEPLGHYDVGSARRYLGFCLMDQERFAEAEREFVAVERFFRSKVGDDHPMVWAALISEGWARLRLGRLEEAERTLTSVVEHYDRAGLEGNEIRTALKYLGETVRRRGRPLRALELHRRAREIEVKIFGTAAHPGVAASDLQIALDLLDLGAPGYLAEARRDIDEGLAFLRANDPGHPRLGEFLIASGRIALATGDRERARRDLADALTRLRALHGESHPFTREAAVLLRRTG